VQLEWEEEGLPGDSGSSLPLRLSAKESTLGGASAPCSLSASSSARTDALLVAPAKRAVLLLLLLLLLVVALLVLLVLVLLPAFSFCARGAPRNPRRR